MLARAGIRRRVAEIKAITKDDLVPADQRLKRRGPVRDAGLLPEKWLKPTPNLALTVVFWAEFARKRCAGQRTRGEGRVQGYLAHKKYPPP